MIKELFSALFPVLFIFLCIGAAILWAKAIEEEYTTPPKKPNPPKFPMYTKEDLEFLHWLVKSPKSLPKEPKYPERPPEPMC